MKVFAVLLNILMPGIGSFMVGKVGPGIGQMVLWGFGLVLTLSTFGVGGIIGLPLMLIAWVWAIVSASSSPKPMEVTVVEKRS